MRRLTTLSLAICLAGGSAQATKALHCPTRWDRREPVAAQAQRYCAASRTATPSDPNSPNPNREAFMQQCLAICAAEARAVTARDLLIGLSADAAISAALIENHGRRPASP